MASLSAVGGQIEKRDATLNERLNKANDTIEYQCDRLGAVLARVNGTPQPSEVASASVKPMMSMTNAVEKMETLVLRLGELANDVERIA